MNFSFTDEHVLRMFDFIEERGAWINVADGIIEEMKKKYGLLIQ